MGEQTTKPSKPVILKTPQSIVHIKHTVSLRQYKYWVLLLRFYREFFEAGELPDKKGFYTVPIAKVGDFIGYEPMKAELKTDFEALRKEPIIINFLDKDGKKATHGMGFISEWKITSKTIAFKIPSFLEEVMRGDNEATKIFQLLNWNIFNSFNGKYEAIIYKLCKDYIGVGRTPYMTVEEYREYIGLKDNEYNPFFRLNEWTITNPIKSINKNEIADIEVSVEYKRTGRKVEGLYFTVKHKQQTSIPFPDFEPHPAFAFAKVSINVQDQHKYLEIMPPEEIQATIDRANQYGESLKQQGKKAQMGAIYHKAFAERWGIQHLEQQQTEKQTKAQAQTKRKQAQAETQKAQEEENNKKLESKPYYERFEVLTENEKKAMIEEYIKTVPSVMKGMVQRAYDSHGTDAYKHSNPFKGLFSGFLKEKLFLNNRENENV